MATKAELDKLTAKIRKLFKKWEFLVVDQGYTFDVEYYENHLESDKMLDSENVTMQCWTKWKYKHSIIAVNLQAVNDPRVRLEWIIIHELVHILQGDCEYETVSIEERACSEIASAILQASVEFLPK